jgi:hypothetical protein
MSKKGQMEIIGFMIIILLLFFSLLIYFQLSSKDDTDLLTEAEENLEVSNMLATIKLYTVCEDDTLGDAIKECINGGFACGEDACVLVEREVAALVEAWGWDADAYSLIIGGSVVAPVAGEDACSGNSFVDDYSTSSTTVQLKFCY